MSKFNIGDLVQLIDSEHIGIVIEKTAWGPDTFNRRLTYSYRIKWAVGEPFTWEKPEHLIMKARTQ